MAKEVLYLKLERNVEVQQDEVRMKDLGKYTCRDQKILDRIKAMKVMTFHPEEDGGRKVISVMHLIELLSEEFPTLDVENIGETEVVVERVGAAFTIIAFHNDISIIRVFDRIYELVAGQKPDGVTVLEVSYSIGLAVGIIAFFNHIGGRRLTKDPTPIEVEMRVYEDQVNQALAETADREGKTMDVS